MGVDPPEAREVGRLVGLKVFATELLAFEELGVSIREGIISVSSFLHGLFSLFKTFLKIQ